MISYLLPLLFGAATPEPPLDWPTEPGRQWTFSAADGSTGLILEARSDGKIHAYGPTLFWGSDFQIAPQGGDWVLTDGALINPAQPAPWTLIDQPLRVGKSWQNRVPGLDHCFQFTVTAEARETITVPAGTFDAWRLSYRLDCHLGTERDFDLWVADGVGPVQLAQVARSTLAQKTPLEPQPTFKLSHTAVRSASAEPPARGDLVLRGAATGAGRVGEPLPVRFLFENVGGEAFHVVPSLDASDVGWRYPKIDLTVTRDGEPIETPEFGRCGVMNPLTEDDLRLLQPGETLDPFGPGTFSHHRLSWAPEEPGEYVVSVVYDFGQHEEWHQAGPSLKPGLETVPTGMFTTSVTVNVTH